MIVIFDFPCFSLSFSAQPLDANRSRSNSSDGDSDMQFDYVIREGITNLISYGLTLAKTVHFPAAILPRAEAIYQQIGDADGNELQEEEVASSLLLLESAALQFIPFLFFKRTGKRSQQSAASDRAERLRRGHFIR